MIKVLSVFGTRPEIIKFIPVLRALEAHPECESVVCITGQHREMLDQMLPLANITPDVDLDLMVPNQTLQGLSARMMAKMDELLPQVKPDRVLVQGDTSSGFIAATAAFYGHIPVGHIEAGLRSGDLTAPWPEEFNRRAIGIVTDMHFVPTQTAGDVLRGEKVPESDIYFTGNPVIDALYYFRDVVKDKAELKDQFSFLNPEKRLILVTAHRREHFDGGIENVCRAIKTIAERGDCEVVFPVHLNPNVQGPVHTILGDAANVHLMEPQDYLSFLWLMDKAHLILSDSGGVQEEAPSLQKPVLVMRDTTERPEGIEAGVTKLVGTQTDVILNEAMHLLDDEAAYKAMQGAQDLYGDGKAAQYIVEAIVEKHKGT